jgi:hypothetical protein
MKLYSGETPSVIRKQSTALTYIRDYFDADAFQPSCFSYPPLMMQFKGIAVANKTEIMGRADKSFGDFVLGGEGANGLSVPYGDINHSVYAITKAYAVHCGYATFTNFIIKPKHRQYRLSRFKVSSTIADREANGWEQISPDTWIDTND